MESKAIISEAGALSYQAQAQQLASDLAAHAAKGLESHADSRLLLGTPYLDEAGGVVSSDTFRFRTVKSDGTFVLIDLPVILYSGQPITGVVSAPAPPDAPMDSTVPTPSASTAASTVASTTITTGGGCFPKMTPIKMANGTWKRIEDLVEGDMLTSFDIAGLNPSVEEAWKLWRSANLKLTQVETSVKAVRTAKFNRFYILEFSDGTTLQVTYEHVFLYERDWLWKFGQAVDLKVGDKLSTGQSTKLIVGKDEIVTNIVTYNLDVEPYDVYIADGVIAHNSFVIYKN